MCDCRQAINEKLGEHNGRLASGFSFGGGKMEFIPVLITTEKIDTRSRKKPPIVIASYCPWCGEQFEEENHVRSKSDGC